MSCGNGLGKAEMRNVVADGEKLRRLWANSGERKSSEERTGHGAEDFQMGCNGRLKEAKGLRILKMEGRTHCVWMKTP